MGLAPLVLVLMAISGFPNPFDPPMPPRAALTVTKSGAGSGTVTGVGVDCGTDCAHVYNKGYTVALTATPAGGSTFSGWSGAGTGTGLTRTVLMDQAQSVGAAFASEVLSISATVTRYDGGSGAYTVTNGVAFRPGDVTTTALTNRQLRVFVSGVEQAIYTEALDGRHPDGTVKVVLIQFITTIGATPLSAEIRLGETRVTTDIAKQAINSWPRVLLFPSSATFLTAAQPFWRPLTPMTDRPTTPAFWDKWEGRYSSQVPDDVGNPIGSKTLWDDALTQAPPNRWDDLYAPSSYQWARHHYEFFAMKGDGTYLDRSIGGAYIFISEYAGANNFGLPEWNNGSSVDYLLHYWMTGDTVSRDGIRLAAQSAAGHGTLAEMTSRTYEFNYGRLLYNVLAPLVMGHHLNLSPVANVWPSETGPTWDNKATALKNGVINQQFPDGHNTWDSRSGTTPKGQQHWMWFELSTAMIMYHAWVNADAAIQPHIQAGFDYINNNYWFPATLAWSLGDVTGFPDPAESAAGAPDLNGFGMEVVGWLYRKTLSAPLKARGDQAINGIADFAFWPTAGNAPKQFNEAHWGSWPWIAARLN